MQPGLALGAFLWKYIDALHIVILYPGAGIGYMPYTRLHIYNEL